MPLALFDLDETLINADSATLWNQWMVKQGLVADGDHFMQQEADMMTRYGAGELDMADYMAFTLQPLKGLSALDITAMMPEFVRNNIEPCIYPDARILIQQLRQAGYRVVIISATAEFVVRGAARALGVDDVLAIQLEYDDQGHHTGRTTGTLTFREGKVKRLKEWMQTENESLDNARFYSDSMNDLPLLEQVTNPFATNPDRRLRALAMERNWPVIDWEIRQ
ncbi:HAD family hydrolase [Oceanospirillum sediminis]|uniref:HAD family hydrolase n=1 Tax=Oceanospirillum sediminis TaxID=2760088 RepID=A0A839INR3_9GAMM|nr:HAD family hydrolase [Oceanospirillum sediminis]MBB1486139.1 HAD family hydrolase [Oceanospirillum sediminis]